MMGGVDTDVWGRTSLPGLFAAGEVACTGRARRQPAGEQLAARRAGVRRARGRRPCSSRPRAGALAGRQRAVDAIAGAPTAAIRDAVADASAETGARADVATVRPLSRRATVSQPRSSALDALARGALAAASRGAARPTRLAASSTSSPWAG